MKSCDGDDETAGGAAESPADPRARAPVLIAHEREDTLFLVNHVTSVSGHVTVEESLSLGAAFRRHFNHRRMVSPGLNNKHPQPWVGWCVPFADYSHPIWAFRSLESTKEKADNMWKTENSNATKTTSGAQLHHCFCFILFLKVSPGTVGQPSNLSPLAN